MKPLKILICCFSLFLSLSSSAQEIVYSEFKAEDDKDINFEILGKMNNGYIIYKNIRWKHMLTLYDNDMRIKKNMRLKFVPDKTFNIDFITYPGHFYMIYQYQKDNIVHCMGVKMAADGSKLTEPVELDSTRIPVLADNKIYNTVYSQDKQRIMVYKMHKKNQMLTFVTKLFDAELRMLDSTRVFTEFDNRKEVYSEIVLDNSGTILLAKETRDPYKDNIDGLVVLTRRPGSKEFKSTDINLQGNYIDEVKLKVDNLNKQYLINSLFYTHRNGNIKGLFTLLVDAATQDTVKSVFNFFEDSVRSRINSSGQYRTAFDNFFIRQVIVKKDGGFILTAEDFSSSTSRSGSPSNWNRSDYLYNSPNISTYDYYLSSPAYDNYRPQGRFGSWQNTRYYYDKILVVSFDKNLDIVWNSIIPKTQVDDESDNFLSFSAINVGAEIHFLFNENDRRQIISNQSILPGGEVKRYPTLKSREAGYHFMPRLAKQVGYREVIIPCIFQSNIAFAKVNITE